MQTKNGDRWSGQREPIAGLFDMLESSWLFLEYGDRRIDKSVQETVSIYSDPLVKETTQIPKFPLS